MRLINVTFRFPVEQVYGGDCRVLSETVQVRGILKLFSRCAGFLLFVLLFGSEDDGCST